MPHQQPLSVEIYCRKVDADAPRKLAAAMPAGVVAQVAEREPDWEGLSGPLAQSWQLPEREAALEKCRYVVTVRESDAAGERPARLKRVQEAVGQSLRIVHGEAIHCVHARQVIPPGLFITETESRGLPCLEAGAVNVRLFRVDGDDRAGARLVMDTIGLAAFGLPDLQVDYRMLQPSAVAETLFAGARYLFRQGDVIEAGHSIEGCLPGSRWKARRERSIVEPFREVIDLDPGSPYSSREPAG